MSYLQCTIYFTSEPIGKRLATAFDEAGLLLHLRPYVFEFSHSLPNSQEAWQTQICRFPRHAWTGNVRWQFRDQNKILLQGWLHWPICNPNIIPGTIEFDFPWGNSKSTKYQFIELSLLLKFLHALSLGVQPKSLLIELKRRPDHMIEEQGKRFRMLHDKVTLTNIDWIFGLRTNDTQYKQLKKSSVSFAAIIEQDGFAVMAIKDSPLNYADPGDMALLRSVEKVIGLYQ